MGSKDDITPEIIYNQFIHSFCFAVSPHEHCLTVRDDFVLTLSLLLTTQGAIVDSADQDQTVQNMYSDL